MQKYLKVMFDNKGINFEYRIDEVNIAETWNPNTFDPKKMGGFNFSIAEMNNIPLNVDERFGERKFGVKNINELSNDYFEQQWSDLNYKIAGGESINEVQKRMLSAFYEVLNNNKDKTIMIISHGTALTAMLKEWCDIKLNYDKKLLEIYFNDNLVFDGNWNCPELFKLEFDDNVLLDIKNIKM